VSNADAVRLFYEVLATPEYGAALAAGELKAFLDEPGQAHLFDYLDPELAIVEPAEIPDQHTWQGPDAYLRAMEQWPSHWDDFVAELVEIEERGDVVFHESHHRGTARGSSLALDIRVFNVQWFRDGKMYRWEMYLDRDEALAVAGFES
jgi:ketosteroid isomerase-like protein